ncbi:MAG: type II toxin-antitoxin system prevent-host-death family antitoxin [Boseongicola sp.]|nr:type II toxin-antitoxin system prevent-host-death family antitoxin [Boseongicola sp.]
MKTVNMHEAKTNLSRLVAAAARGEAFIIARAGKPLVKVEPIAPEGPRRLGFLAGQGAVPDDFDRIGADEIAEALGR